MTKKFFQNHWRHKLIRTISHLQYKIGLRLPFQNVNIVKRILDKEAKTVLDVGSGKGEAMNFIKKGRRLSVIGVDIFEPYLRQCRKNKTHDELVLCDVRFLPFKEKSFDVVLAIEVLEHLEKDDGLKLLHAIEKISRKQVIITTPNSSYHTGWMDPEEADGNLWQAHQALWTVEELQREGYEVKGASLAELKIRNFRFRLNRPKKEILDLALNLLRGFIWLLGARYAYSHPESAIGLIAVKDNKRELPVENL